MISRRTLLALGGIFVAFALFKAVQGPDTSFHVAAASPMRDVLVYAKPVALSKDERIWVAAADGSHPRFLVDGTTPSVSPDGRYVAYGSGDGKVLVVPTA